MRILYEDDPRCSTQTNHQEPKKQFESSFDLKTELKDLNRTSPNLKSDETERSERKGLSVDAATGGEKQ